MGEYTVFKPELPLLPIHPIEPLVCAVGRSIGPGSDVAGEDILPCTPIQNMAGLEGELHLVFISAHIDIDIGWQGSGQSYRCIVK